MPIDVSGSNLASTFTDAVRRGVERAGVEDVRVLVPDEFVTTVASLTSEDAYADERGTGGQVAARTLLTPDGEVVIVVNSAAMADRTLAELERLLAHEAGHVHMLRRGEALEWDVITSRCEGHWEQMITALADVATDEYRAEADLYDLGYPVEEGRTDADLAKKLFEFNLSALAAMALYRNDHLDPGKLRDDALECVAISSRYLTTVAARHLHGHPVRPEALPPHAQENWGDLVAPTWQGLLDHLADLPSATTPWSLDDRLEASVQLSEVLDGLARSLGFLGEPEAIWIALPEEEFEQRRARANAEAALYGSDSS